MSKLLKAHQPCIDCGSSDALAEYEDNTYCFSCHRMHRKRVGKPMFPEPEVVHDPNHTLLMPPKCIARFTPKAKTWLLTYSIYSDLREKYGIVFLPYGNISGIILQQRIILPVRDKNDKLVCYQARATLDGDTPKYITVGNRDHLFYSKDSPGDPETIVLTEDILSAIRIGEFLPSAALMGTTMTEQNRLTLSKKCATIIIWMDGDRAGQTAAKKLMKQFQLTTSKVINIKTDEDPKCLHDGTIKEKLDSCLA